MLQFLMIGREGIDMNLIYNHRPTHIYRSNLSPFLGLGGYSHEGFAWRFKLTHLLCFRASNNVIEYIALIVSPWIDMLAERLPRGDCMLSMTDSSTLAGWLQKTNFREVFLTSNRRDHDCPDPCHSLRQSGDQGILSMVSWQGKHSSRFIVQRF